MASAAAASQPSPATTIEVSSLTQANADSAQTEALDQLFAAVNNDGGDAAAWAEASLWQTSEALLTSLGSDDRQSV